MEILLVLMGVIFASTFFIDKATEFVKQIKSSGSAKLTKGFKATISLVPIDKKSEVSATNTNSTTNDT